MIKDPQAKLDYTFDWADLLDADETIAEQTTTVTAGDAVVSGATIAGETVRVWVEGGTDGSVAEITNHVVTSKGREDDLVLVLEIANAVDYTALATRMIRRLTGGKWTWPPMQVRDLFTVPKDTAFLQLRAEPVLEVVSVEDYATGEPIEFDRMGSNRIELLDASRRPCAVKRRVDVVYNYGNRPSSLVARAIRMLASELQKADIDDDSCRLPERVTSVTRQGVSWTLIDPMDFLDKGRTGIIEVDMAINAATLGSKSRARPRVFSPEFPVPDRLSATELPIPVGV